jgi:glycosyltransferase involved in cell wall biosynthesis
MKVLRAITSLSIGGAESRLVESIPIYLDQGIQMEVLLLQGTETYLLTKLQKMNIPIHILNNRNSKSVYNPINIFKTIPYLKKYDIIHVHLFPTLYWIALAKLFSFSKTKLIYTEHSTSNGRRKYNFLRPFEKYIYNLYDFIVSITPATDAAIKSHLSLNTQKFRIIYNGIDLSPYISSKIRIPNISQVTIIQVSSFRNSKDQMTLIRSLVYVPINIRLVLIGDGENRSVCEASSEKLNLSDRISFWGIRRDVPQLLQNVADIVVLSSHWEGFGAAAIEGMAAGKPVIASDVPGLREVVAGAGLLFPAGDERILAERINDLLSNSDYYEKVARACLVRSKEYNINKMVNQYIELYKSI